MHFPLTMPGSKRRVFPQILPHVPAPALGGGILIPFFGTGADAQYFHAKGYRLAHCGDGNPHLCKLYRQLRDARPATMQAISAICAVFPSDLEGQRGWYHDTRARYNEAHLGGEDTPDTAAAFLAVWRTAFNGLARANRDGAINAAAGMAPSNGTKKSVVDLRALDAFAQWLATIPPVVCTDYANTVGQACSGDVVYLDPPYVGTFDGYFGEGFDTERCISVVSAIPADIAWAMSNACHPRWAVDLPEATQVPISRAGTFSGGSRESVSEILLLRPIREEWDAHLERERR